MITSDGVWRWFIALVVLVVLVFSRCAHATTVIPNGTATLNYVTGGVQLMDGPGAGTFIGRTFANPSTAARTVGVTEQVGLTLSGRSLVATVGRTLSFAEIMGPAAAIGGAAWAGWQIGTGIAKTLGLGNASNGTRCVPTASGWSCDDGQAAQQSQVLQYLACWGPTGCSSLWANSKQGALDLTVAWYQTVIGNCSGTYSGQPWSFTPTVIGVLEADGTYTLKHLACNANGTSGPGYTIDRQAGFSTRNGSQNTCPGFIDALDPRLSRPAGDAPGPDGKCATGRYSGVTAEVVAQKVATYGDPSNLDQLAQSVLDKGASISTSSPRSISSVSPSSVTGTPVATTTTNPDGSKTVSTTTPTLNFTPSGDTITYNISNTTVNQSCTAAGSCTTTNTTTATQPKSNPDDTTDCEKNPGTVGCAQLGTPGSDSPTWQTKTFVFSEEDLGFGSGSCPAPVSWHVNMINADLNWSYQVLCDVAPTVKLGFLSFLGVGLIIWIVSSLKV